MTARRRRKNRRRGRGGRRGRDCRRREAASATYRNWDLNPPFKKLLVAIPASPPPPDRPPATKENTTCSWAGHGIVLEVSHSVFVADGAYGSTVYFSLWLNLPHAHTDCDELPLPAFPEVRWVRRSQMSPHLRAADGSDGWSQFVQWQLSLCFKSNTLLFNMAEGLDSAGLASFQRMAASDVRAIGPMLVVAGAEHGGPVSQPRVALDQCVRWLNRHEP